MSDLTGLVCSHDKLEKVSNFLLLLTAKLIFKSKVIEKYICVIIIAAWMIKDGLVLIRKCFCILLVLILVFTLLFISIGSKVLCNMGN